MPDLHTLLAAEAARREPPARPPFDALLRRRRRRTWSRRGLGGVAVAGVLAAGVTLPGVLGAAPGRPGRAPGGSPPVLIEVTGQLVEVGGPAPGPPRGVPGAVRFTGQGRPVSVDTDAGGHFTVELAPGTYTVTGTSPLYGDGQYTCRADAPLVVPDTGLRPGPDDVIVSCQLR